MNTKAIFVGDVVEENGKTVKENNLEKQHTFPVGSLVEVLGPEDSKGLRLFVMRHSRDCDGSPLYRDWETDRKSTRLNSSHSAKSRMPSSA